MLRPVEKWSSQFATEVDIFATKFDTDLHIPHVERAITRFLGEQFREFHCRIHKYYKRAGSDRHRHEKPYDGVSQEDWEMIITWFETYRKIALHPIAIILHAHESKQRVEELTSRLVDTDLRVEELQSWKTSSEAKLEFLMQQFAGAHAAPSNGGHYFPEVKL
ncbi:hypothetical protein IFM89_020122 [Coptis chinensis]|uniref:Uncharacterized protein n=1 Tax=Coptis chinensis TaxID=261450 RepID=A0A835IZM9_9MAGN|nr:hypothetical protein IFM89_020122 [Coptis chinensis]